MQFSERGVENTMAETIATGIPSLMRKSSEKSEQLRTKVIRHYLHFHLRNSTSVESARRILRTALSHIEGTRKVRIEPCGNRIFEIAELIGLEFDVDSTSIDDVIHNVLTVLEQFRGRLSDVVKSRSERTILDLLNILEEDKLNKRSCLDKSVDDLMESLISAFEPERLLNTLDQDEASLEWLKKNSLYEELKNKYENIQKYRESGKFLRDFWILNNQNSRHRI